MTYEKNDFHGYSLFKDIMNEHIRAWNRAVTVYNIKERHGDKVANEYCKNFSRPDLAQIFTIMVLVKEEGYENVRREIFRETVNAA